jgi:glycerate kinase
MPRFHPVVVIAPDSFKGSVSAVDVASAIGDGLRRVWSDVEVRACPMADGGEGTLDALLARGGTKRHARVTGAGGEPVDAASGLLGDGKTVVIEAAQVVGLTDRNGVSVDVERRTTRGLGELIREYLDSGARDFMIALGGSSTNDGGAGLLVALGLALADARGRGVDPTPEGLASLASVDASSLDPRILQSRITIMSDVDNPLTGERGATAIFGPQKGVRSERIAALDATLERFASIAEKAVGRSVRNKAGAGAAGGLGFALQLLGGEMRSGAELVADLVGLDEALRGADWLITGEGRTDLQTMLGKTPWIVAHRGARASVPATLISGGIDRAALPRLAERFAGCFSLPDGPMTLEECVANAARLLADRGEQAARLFDAALRQRAP